MKPPRMIDIVEFEQANERSISGRCAMCGDYLLATIEKTYETSSGLSQALADSFRRHLDGQYSHFGGE